MKTQKKANHKKWLASLMSIFLMCPFATYGSVDTDDMVDFSVNDDQVTIIFKTVGTYNLALTFTDNNGLTHYIDKQVNITTLSGDKPDIRIDSRARDSSEDERTVSLNCGNITQSDAIDIVQATANRDKTHMLMQFENEPSRADRDELKTQGINLLDSAAEFSYWVSIDGNSTASQAPDTIQIAGGIKWAWIPTTACKVAEAIDNNNFPDNARYDDGTVRVHIMVFGDVLQADVETAISNLAQKLAQKIEVLEWVGEDMLVVRTSLEAIDHLATLDEIKWMEPAPPPNTIDVDETNGDTSVNTVELQCGNITQSNTIDIVQATANRDKTHMLMQFENEPSRADRDELKTQGINLLDSAAEFSYWVSIDGNSTASQAPDTIQIAGGIKWAWIPTTACKVAEAIDNNNFPDNARYDDGTVRVHIMVFGDVSQVDVETAISNLAQKLDQRIDVLNWVGIDVLVVRTSLEAINHLAALDEIKWIEPAPPPNTIDVDETNGDTSVNVVKGITIDTNGQVTTDTDTTFSSKVCVSNWKATLNESDTVDIQGTITVDQNHVGQTADMVVVARQPLINEQSLLFMLNTEKVFVLWDFNVATLEPFTKDDNLKLEAVQSLNVFQSSSLPMGIWSLYFGYRLQDGTVVVNSQSIDMTIK